MLNTVRTKPAPSRLRALDWVRGAAALWVLSYHLHEVIRKPKYFGVAFDFSFAAEGYRGVQVFFILSGMVMLLSVFDQNYLPKITFSQFWCRRVFRIFPLYWLVYFPMLAAIALGLWSANMADPFRWGMMLENLLLLPRNDLTSYIPVSAWTLSYELVFYLIFSLLLLNKPAFWLCSCLLLGTSSWMLLGKLESEPASFFVSANWLLFYVGIGIGYLYRKFTLRPFNAWRMVLAMMVALFVLPSAANYYGQTASDVVDLVYIIIFAVLVAALSLSAINIGEVLMQLLDWLGRISYGVYLINYQIAILVAMVMKRLGMDAIPLYILLTLLLTLLISDLLYRWVERPCMAWGAKIGQ